MTQPTESREPRTAAGRWLRPVGAAADLSVDWDRAIRAIEAEAASDAVAEVLERLEKEIARLRNDIRWSAHVLYGFDRTLALIAAEKARDPEERA